MFARFCVQLCVRLMNDGYQVPQLGLDDFAKTQNFLAGKHDMGAITYVHVFDMQKTTPQAVSSYSQNVDDKAEKLLGSISQVCNIYILYGGDAPQEYDTQDYVGQKIFRIIWCVAPDGSIAANPGQPRDFFGLAKMIRIAATSQDANPDAVLDAGRIRSATAAPKHRVPIVAYGIIAINLIILLLMYRAGYPDFYVPMRFGAIVPDLIIHGGQWYRLFSAIFVHFGPAHFAANAFGIYIFGSRIEKYLGRGPFIAAYVITGLVGSLFSLYFSRAYAAGASGAVYGLVGMLFVYTRLSRQAIEFVGWYLMLLYIGIGIAIGFASEGVDNFAHIGGLLAGIVVGLVYWKLQRVSTGQPANKYSDIP